ncbi:phospholipase B1, membrane-associated-like [Eupeodes corollae]|uniref:phospholipase B1, membrane-associated-like n=1 Tax=Eupeodes corollae TaxID=290404 RepID=UPI002492FE44|nr:phospholipase B1, membrane-associated-like [Eupeodes corollae]XP_055923426.1 phospholipase B1, membrane-associated-like [Eupeodes corollae]XP_055923427.1 phospholipase B1, membrane-associated-like [Eupeodes corollae]
MGNFIIVSAVWFCFILSGLQGQQYSTYLDAQFARPLGMVRKFIANLSGEQSQINKIYRLNKKLGKIQPQVPQSQRFHCDAKNGPGRRSSKPPESVDEVRPGDIDIIAAIGDSLTAANGAISNELYSLFNENRGISFSAGGRGDWRKYLTLPNILREFNNDLYGYSTEDCLSIDRASKFNVAEATTRFEDMVFQSKVLLKRMQRDPKVNMTSHWKMITVFIGSNDLCAKLCDLSTPEDLIKEHAENTYKTLRFLRQNVPRAIINWIILPNLVKLIGFKNVPTQCYIAERVECRCIYSSRATPETLKRYENIVTKIQQDQKEIIYQDEFNTNTFTVNLQLFGKDFSLPKLPSGDTDLRYFASDCFHFSQLGQAAAANALWNNIMEPEGKKLLDWMPAFKQFECPTNERPYIATRTNSK